MSVNVESLFNTPQSSLNRRSMSGEEYWRGPLKRRLDIVVSGAALAGALPIIGLLATAAWAEDGGPGLIRLKSGDAQVLKIRTMVPNAEQQELEIAKGRTINELKKENDPRVTRLGSWIRKTSLDELPQLLQVIKGEWSMVGPRIPGMADWMVINQNLNSYPYKDFSELLESGIKPGITGAYGIGGRADLPFEKRLKLELEYGNKASFRIDMKILAFTIPAVLSRRGAY